MVQKCDECVRWIVMAMVGRVAARFLSQKMVRATAVAVAAESIHLDAPLPVVGPSRMEEDHGWPIRPVTA